MKELTIEEMKEISAAAACSAGYSCMEGLCWKKVKVQQVEFWITSGEGCGSAEI